MMRFLARHKAARDADPEKASLPRLPWRTRLGLLAFGTIVGVVLLEVFLRTLGFVYYHERQYMPGDHPEDACVILCIGDSATFGQGAANPKRQGYPAQLERLLRERHPDRHFRVVNMGFPGANSSQVARRLESWLRLHDPDLVIALIGNNDLWNRNESNIHLFGDGDRASSRKAMQARLRVWGDELRVVRLARCVALSIDDDREKRWNPDEDTHPDKTQFRRGADVLGAMANVAALYRYNFRRIEREVRRAGAQILWLDYHMPAFLSETDHIESVLRELGGPYLHLGPYFHDADMSIVAWNLIWRDKWHANELGYGVVARAVYNKLAELHYAPGPPVEVMDLKVH